MNKVKMVGLMAVFAATLGFAGHAARSAEQTVASAYPSLSSGALADARLSSLADDLVLKSGDLELTRKDLNAAIRESPEELWPQLKRNLFFVLENKATERLLTYEAESWAVENADAPRNGESLLDAYMDSLCEGISVSDEEIRQFFDKNRDMMGDAPLDQVRDQLKGYINNQKRQQIVDARTKSLSKRYDVAVDKDWVAKQNSAAMDNPVDKARQSGKPSLVDFGADGCRPCEMMTPILETLKKDYAGKLNVLFVHVRKEQVLGARYGVQSIPVQVFYDKDGKEVFRHVGFFAKEQIEAKLSEIGVK